MHVTIAQLTECVHDGHHYGEDEVYADNSGKFYDGVEERYGEERDEAIDEMCNSLGAALVGRGLEKADGGEVAWVEIDPGRTGELFIRPFHEFVDAQRSLGKVSLQGFVDGDSTVATTIQRLREAYAFDWLYILSEYNDAKPVSEWLRGLRYEARDKHGVRRFYVHGIYNGNQ